MTLEEGSKESGKEFLAKHREEVCQKADDLLTNVLPNRIATLNELSKGERFSWNSLQKVKELPVMDEDNKLIINAYIIECVKLLKPYLREFMDSCILLRTWVTLLVPKSEDGDNLGIQVQFDVLNEANENAGIAQNIYNSFDSYYLSMAMFMKTLKKYPETRECVKSSIEEYHECEFLRLKNTATKLYFYYLSMYDTIMKNIDKIKKPRNDSHELYYTF